MERVFININKLFAFCFGLLFLYAFSQVLLFDWLNEVSPLYVMVAKIGCIILFFLSIYILYRTKELPHTWTRFLKKYYKVLFILSLGLLFAVQILIVYSLKRDVGWDMQRLNILAEQMMTKPMDSIDFSYLNMYPNNSLLVVFLVGCQKVFAFMGLRISSVNMSVVNIIFVDFAGIMLYQVVKFFKGRRLGYASFVIYVLLIGVSPWIMVPYSDTLSILYPITLFYLFILLYNKACKRIYICAFAFGVLALVGYQIKPTNIIVLIAIAIFVVLRVLQLKNIIRIASLSSVVILGVLSAYLTTSFLIQTTFDGRIDNSQSIPMTHFMMMGLKKQKFGKSDAYKYGGYSNDDFEYTKSFETKGEKTKATMDVIKKRLGDYGVLGYANYINGKVNWILGDGTFYWQHEGWFFRSKPRKTNNAVVRGVQQFYFLGGKYNKVFTTFEQTLWLMLLLAIGCSVLVVNKNKRDEYFIIRMSVFGMMLFLILFEARSRYLINYLPFFIMLALLSLDGIQETYIVDHKLSLPNKRT